MTVLVWQPKIVLSFLFGYKGAYKIGLTGCTTANSQILFGQVFIRENLWRNNRCRETTSQIMQRIIRIFVSVDIQIRFLFRLLYFIMVEITSV